MFGACATLAPPVNKNNKTGFAGIRKGSGVQDNNTSMTIEQNNRGNKIDLSIGDIAISIIWEDSQVVDWPFRFYKDFIFYKDLPDIVLEVKCGDIPDYKRGEIVFDANKHWKLYKSDDGYIFEEFDVLTGEMDRVILMNKSLEKGVVYITPDPIDDTSHLTANPQWSVHRLLNPLLILLVSNWLIKRDGLMIHGLGINYNGKGILFTGRSGAGKSTLADMFKGKKGVDIINDEKTILKRKGESFFIQGTPWPGDSRVCASQTVPLQRIFFLRHSKKNVVSSLSFAESFPYFYSQLFLPFWNRDSLEYALNFSNDLITTLRPSQFGFLKDKTAVDYIRRLLC